MFFLKVGILNLKSSGKSYQQNMKSHHIKPLAKNLTLCVSSASLQKTTVTQQQMLTPT